MGRKFYSSFSFSYYPSGASAHRSQISSSHGAADLAKSKKQSSHTLPSKNKKNRSAAFPQSSDTEESDYEPEDYTQWGQQSSNKKPDYDPGDHTQWCPQSSNTEEFDYEPEDCFHLFQQSSNTEEFFFEPEDSSHLRSSNKAELDYDTKDSAIAKMDSLQRDLGWCMASSSKPEQTRSKNVRNGGRGLTTYIPDDSTAYHDSLHCALCRDMVSSSKPEQTRSKNVRNGGSGHMPCFPDDSNRCSTFINTGNANIVNNYSYLTTINQVGHNFIQNGGSRDSRQFQAVKVSGGTVTQGNVEDDMEDDG